MSREITLRFEHSGSLESLTKHSTDCVAAWLSQNADGTYSLTLEEPLTADGLRALRSGYKGVPSGPPLRTENEWAAYKIGASRSDATEGDPS